MFLFTILIVTKITYANENVQKTWCFGNNTGYQPGSHPLPGLKNSFDPCPGKYLKKIPFKNVISHFSSGEGKQFVCELLDGASPLNQRLTVYFDLVDHIKLKCVNKKEKLLKKQALEKAKKEKLLKKQALENAKKVALIKAGIEEEQRKRKITEERNFLEAKKIKEKEIQILQEKQRKISEEKNKKKKEEAKKAREINLAKQTEKKKLEQEKFNLKLNRYQRKASNFYKDIEEYVKSGADIDLVILSEYFDVKPNPQKKWSSQDLSRYENLRQFMTSVKEFVSFEKNRIGMRLKKSFAMKDKAIVKLEKNLNDLKGLMRKMFGSSEIPKIKKQINDIQSILSSFNQKTAENVIKETSFYIASKLPQKSITKAEKALTKTKKTAVSIDNKWLQVKNNLMIQQQQFCQLTDRFFDNLKKAKVSKNEIKVNMVHKERQENLDALIPKGTFNNWIFKVIKIDQVEDGSAAVVLGLQCRSFVGSGQTIDVKKGMNKKDKKQWRATIPYDDRRFRELAKLDTGQFIVGSGTMLEINAYKPGQKETFYASQEIGEHPLTKGLNLEGELFIADLTYIAALN